MTPAAQNACMFSTVSFILGTTRDKESDVASDILTKEFATGIRRSGRRMYTTLASFPGLLQLQFLIGEGLGTRLCPSSVSYPVSGTWPAAH